jgi:hypothetical protein
MMLSSIASRVISLRGSVQLPTFSVIQAASPAGESVSE